MAVEPKDFDKKGRKKASNVRQYFRLPERMSIDVQRIEKPEAYMDDSAIKRIGPISRFHTADISAGGLQFFSTVFYKENSYAEITLNFKAVEPPFEPIKVIVRILRVLRVENSESCNVIVEYDGISSMDRSYIERYIFVRQREMIAEKRIGFIV